MNIIDASCRYLKSFYQPSVIIEPPKRFFSKIFAMGHTLFSLIGRTFTYFKKYVIRTPTIRKTDEAAQPILQPTPLVIKKDHVEVKPPEVNIKPKKAFSDALSKELQERIEHIFPDPIHAQVFRLPDFIAKLNRLVNEIDLAYDHIEELEDQILIKERTSPDDVASIDVLKTKLSQLNTEGEKNPFFHDQHFLITILDLATYRSTVSSCKEKDNFLKKTFNKGLKGVIDPSVNSVNALSGLQARPHLEDQVDACLRLLAQWVDSGTFHKRSYRDKEDLLRICRHRCILLKYSTLFEEIEGGEKGGGLLKALQQNIEELEDPSSSQIVVHRDGTRSFAIPGGWKEHGIYYEFKKINQKYFFVIHNRGEGSADERLHHFIEFPKDGKIYKQTIVSIEVDKNLLINSTFLVPLIKKNSIHLRSGSQKEVYDHIFTELIEKGGGKIYCPPEHITDLWAEGYNKGDFSEEAIKTVKKELLFHSGQIYGTCVESNFTSTEKTLASPSVLRSLKLASLQYDVEELHHEYKIVQRIEDEKTRAVVIEQASIKIEKLKKKISKQQSELKAKLAQDYSASVIALFNCIADQIPEALAFEIFKLENLEISTKAQEMEKWLEKNAMLLEQVETIDLSNTKLSTLPKSIVLFKNLKTLNLSQNQLEDIPIDLTFLKNLEILILSNNFIESLPPEFKNLTFLKYLDLNSNLISLVPFVINDLDLQVLSLMGNKLTDFPFEWQFKNLHDLRLSDNQLTQLDKSLGDLKNLEILCLSNNKITSVPGSIGKLQLLEFLDLSGNRIETLPGEMIELKQLKVLNLCRNRLANFPEELRKLESLEKLVLDENRIEAPLLQEDHQQNHSKKWMDSVDFNSFFFRLIEHDPELTEWHKNKVESDHLDAVQEADYFKVQMRSPLAFPHLNHLLLSINSLDLSCAQLYSLPSEIELLPNLKILNLKNNALTTLPAEIENLRNLESLDLSENYFNQIPNEIFSLLKLDNLDVSVNLINKIDSGISKLKELKCLILKKNKLEYLPSELFFLKELDFLSLSFNRIKSLPPSFENSTNLKSLHLHKNKLKSLSPGIKKLTHLKDLFLGSNNIEFLPSEIASLKDLKYLDISNNQLKTIPSGIALLPELTHFNFVGNPLESLPRDLKPRG